MTGAPIRLEIDESGYRFFERDDNTWRESGKKQLAHVSFSQYAAIVEAPAEYAFQNERYLNGDSGEEEESVILDIDPIGGISPLAVSFGVEDKHKVSLDAEGQVLVTRSSS